MNAWILTAVQFVAILALSPLSVGMVRWGKARMQGRHGASPLLPYWTIATLLKKEMVISTSTTWVFRLVPFVVFGSALFLAAVLPLVISGGALSIYSHLFLVAAMLAIGALFLVFGGLDSASAFGGMGASREMTIAAMFEPVILASFGIFALATGSPLVDLFPTVGGMGLLSQPALWFGVLTLVLIALAENARYPVDNPATHLELTMVHEAMVLEYSGPYLALLEWASAIKLTVFTLLIGSIVFPMTLTTVATYQNLGLAIGWGIVKLTVGMLLLALLESSIAKMRFYRMQEYATAAGFFAVCGLLFSLIF